MKKAKGVLGILFGVSCVGLLYFGWVKLSNRLKPEISFRNNDPFNADLEGFDCRKNHPNLPHPNPALDAGIEVGFESLEPEIAQLAKKYVHALGYCLYQVQKDAHDSATYEFTLLDLVTYDVIEMDIVAEPDKEPFIEEFERLFSLKRLDYYQDLGFVKDKIEEKCRDSTEEYTYNSRDGSTSGVKVEISYRDLYGKNKGRYPGLTLRGDEIYFEIECIDAKSKRWIEFTVPE